MPTQKQKRIASLIVENSTLDKPLNDGELVENSGYGKSMKLYPKRVIDTPGVLEALSDMGFNAETAKGVVVDIMLDPEKDASSRLKATDQVFKVTGAYAPEKSINLNLNGDGIPNAELELLAQQINDISRNNTRTNIGGHGAHSNALDQEARD